ncbi:hypothetical protein [Embleya sp. AB8]|uniref:hypothetical protein n=1 Tax=Embleya sp. AB8 TaxID=3156304 RepID=UPI003C70E14C
MALPPATEPLAVVRPESAGQSPYLCAVGHFVVAEPAVLARQLWRVDHLGRESEAVVLPVGVERLSLAERGVSVRVAG